MDCIFCKIVKGEIPNYTVYEDDEVLSFLDIAPSAEGHTLVVPKKHYETLAEIPDDELGTLMSVVKRIGPAIMEAVKADGYNVFANNYPAAGQAVPHLHFHIVARFEKDPIKFDWPHGEITTEQAASLLEKIKTLLKA